MFTEKQSIRILSKYLKTVPDVLIILGSGWNKISQTIKIEKRISYHKLFGLKTSVPGHTGEYIVGKIGNQRIGYMSGRIHMYEGYTARESVLPIRVFAESGVKKLILTAACGGLNPKYEVGDIVILSDVLTLYLSLDNPLKGPKFVDMSDVFDMELRQKAKQVCVNNNIKFHEGVYAYYHGPNYETPTDKMALRFLGADVVGMSVVHESITARSYGIKTVGLSYVTNLAFVKHDHKKVLKEAEKGSGKMVKLLTEMINVGN